MMMACQAKLGAAALIALNMSILFTAQASAETIDVVLNQAKIVKLAKPADTIIIGSSEIADATVQDANTVVLTGKSFGVTNLVVFDAAGDVIIDAQLAVSRPTENAVRVYRQGNVQTLSCSPTCEAPYRSEAERISDAEMGR